MTPISERKCKYCNSDSVDDERHFILICETFKIKRQCFIARLNVLHPYFVSMSFEEKFKSLLCPPTIDISKCVSKFLGILTKIRSEMDMGLNPNDLSLYIKHVANSN